MHEWRSQRRGKSWRLACSAAVILGISFAATARATPITYRVEGRITQSIVASMPAGTQYTARLTFDPSTLSAGPDPLGGLSYFPASFSFTAGSVQLGGTGITIAIQNQALPTVDVVRIDGGLSGSFGANLRINLLNDGGLLFGSNAFPNPLPSRGAFSRAQLLINTSTTNFATLDVFEPIPEPATLGLITIGLLSLSAARPRRSIRR